MWSTSKFGMLLQPEGRMKWLEQEISATGKEAVCNTIRRIFNTLVKLHGWETHTWSQIKQHCNICNCHVCSRASISPFSWRHLTGKQSWPAQLKYWSGGGDSRTTTRTPAHCTGAPCSATPAPLTCSLLKMESQHLLQMHGYLHLMSSVSPLHSPLPRELMQVYPLLICIWKHMQNIQPAWNIRFTIFTFYIYGFFLQIKPDFQKKIHWQ